MDAPSAPILLPNPIDLWRHVIEAIPAERPPCRLNPHTLSAASLDQSGAEAYWSHRRFEMSGRVRSSLAVLPLTNRRSAAGAGAGIR